MTPTPDQIQQVIEHLEKEGLIDAICLKAAEIHNLGRYVSDDQAQSKIDEIRAMLSAAPAYAMRNAAEKGGE